MSTQPLWLMEWLCCALDLRSGARVLDLGCGKALTSVFLAREYGVRVVAADMWVEPSENWTRIKEAGCADSVIPIGAEAHDLKWSRSGELDVDLADALEDGWQCRLRSRRRSSALSNIAGRLKVSLAAHEGPEIAFGDVDWCAERGVGGGSPAMASASRPSRCADGLRIRRRGSIDPAFVA